MAGCSMTTLELIDGRRSVASVFKKEWATCAQPVKGGGVADGLVFLISNTSPRGRLAVAPIQPRISATSKSETPTKGWWGDRATICTVCQWDLYAHWWLKLWNLLSGPTALARRGLSRLLHGCNSCNSCNGFLPGNDFPFIPWESLRNLALVGSYALALCLHSGGYGRAPPVIAASMTKPLVQGKVILVQLVQCKVLLATCPTCQWQFGFVDTLRPIPRRRDCDIWPNTSCFISSEFEYIEWQPMRISTTPTSTPASPYLQSSHPTDGILQFLWWTLLEL